MGHPATMMMVLPRYFPAASMNYNTEAFREIPHVGTGTRYSIVFVYKLYT
jgi:hypothetical protein